MRERKGSDGGVPLVGSSCGGDLEGCGCSGKVQGVAVGNCISVRLDGAENKPTVLRQPPLEESKHINPSAGET